MNLTEKRQFMGSECRHFLIVDEDDVKVAGNRATAVTLAALMYRAYEDGSRLELTIPEIIKAQGVWAQSRHTVIRSMAALFERGVIVRSAKGGRDNRYAFTLNQEKIRALLSAKSTLPNDCGCAKTTLPDVPQQHYRTVPDVPKQHIPNKEVRDLGRLRDKEETHLPSLDPPPKPKPLGGWGPLEDQIQKTLTPYRGLFAEPLNHQTVRNLADAFRVKDGSEEKLVGQLGRFLAGIASRRYPKPDNWGAIVWRARTWEGCEFQVARGPEVDDVQLVYLIDQEPAARKPAGSETELVRDGVCTRGA
jgi:hypothetical protein